MPEQKPTPQTVEVPVRAARTAYEELGILIEETADPDGLDRAMTPLARVWRHIRMLPESATRRDVLDVIELVGEATGAETAPVPPLAGNVFEARHQLGRALEEYAEGGDR